MPMQERKSKMPSQMGSVLFRPESVDRENRTVEFVMTTGESGKRYNRYEDFFYMEELQIDENSVRTARLDKGIPLIADHRQSDGIDGVMGVTEDYRFENGQLIGTARFSKREEINDIFDDVVDGILRNVSLGYKVHKYARIRGANDELDTYRSIDLEPLELSLVAIPFETTNGVRAEQRSNENLHEVTIIEEREMPKENLDTTSDQRSADNGNAEVIAAPVEAETRTEVAAPTEARTLLQPMLDVARKAGLDMGHATRAFSDGKTLDEYRAIALDELGNRSQADAPQTVGTGMPVLQSDKRSDEHAQIRSGVENAIMHRADESVELTDNGKNFRGQTLMEMARQYVGSQGHGMSNMQVASRAFASTSDFPLLLENVMNKSLLAGYQEVPRSFQDLGRRTTVSDFRAKNVYRMGDSPDLLPLGEHGEYKSGSMSEAKESYAIDTYARKFGVTRKTLINDDLNVFTRFPSMWGASSARLQNKRVWGLIGNYDFDKGASAGYTMSDGKAVFDAAHKNLLTGAGSALSKGALAKLREMGRKQSTLDGNKMNIAYNKLVIPTSLETDAEELLSSIYYPTSGSQAKINMNLDIIVDPWLDDISNKEYYMFSTSGMMDTFEYAFLSGEEEIYTEVNQHTDVDGFEVKARTDFGCGWIDHRGVAKSDGTA